MLDSSDGTLVESNGPHELEGQRRSDVRLNTSFSAKDLYHELQ
jgi:hypothetical protein